MKVGNKKLTDILYSALILFLVFTFADHLLQGLVRNPSIDLILYTIMWFFIVLQTTLAYIHIMNIKSTDYSLLVFLSDVCDICVAIYVCAVISSTCNENGYRELTNYCHLSVPFVLLSLTQFLWFVKLKEFNVPAIFRISILFSGMLAVTISECFSHNFWNLVVIVGLIVLLGILRAINKAPRLFTKVVTKIWKHVKAKYIKDIGHVQMKDRQNTDVPDQTIQQ